MNRIQLRLRAAAMIEELIDLLDAIDGDSDDEIETDLDLTPISLQGVDRVAHKRLTMRRAA